MCKLGGQKSTHSDKSPIPLQAFRQDAYNIYDNHVKVVWNLQGSNVNASIILHQIMTTYVVHWTEDVILTKHDIAGVSDNVYVRRLQI